MFESASTSAARVSVERRTGRPREFQAAGERLSVTAMEAIRDETAAYPLGTGPRRLFVVRAQGRRYRLVQFVAEGRWTVEELARPHRAAMRAA